MELDRAPGAEPKTYKRETAVVLLSMSALMVLACLAMLLYSQQWALAVGLVQSSFSLSTLFAGAAFGMDWAGKKLTPKGSE